MNKEVVGKQIETIIKDSIPDYQFSVNRLADRLGMSYSYLYEIVYDQFSMSPHRLIELYKMESAIRMIASGRKMIHIYKQLGYGNVRSFREAFGKRFNMNYTTCRSQLINNTEPEKQNKTREFIDQLWHNSRYN